LICLAESLKADVPEVLQKTIYVAYSDAEYCTKAKQLIARLEKQGIATYADLDGRSLKSQLKRANKFGFKWALILNKGEVEAGTYQLKDLRSKEVDQYTLTEQNIEADIKERL